jgi:hypothetical protein
MPDIRRGLDLLRQQAQPTGCFADPGALHFLREVLRQDPNRIRVDLRQGREHLEYRTVGSVARQGRGHSPRLVSDLFSILRRRTEGGQSIVLVEQNAYQSLKLADHVYVLDNGRIASAGTPEEMRQDKMIQKNYLGL